MSHESNIISPSTTWIEAINARRSKLTPAQQAIIQQHASAEECVAYIRGLQAKPKRTDKLLRALLPIIEPLKRFENVIDVVVQTSAGIGSPIWAPLRLAVTVRQMIPPHCIGWSLTIVRSYMIIRILWTSYSGSSSKLRLRLTVTRVMKDFSRLINMFKNPFADCTSTCLI